MLLVALLMLLGTLRVLKWAMIPVMRMYSSVGRTRLKTRTPEYRRPWQARMSAPPAEAEPMSGYRNIERLRIPRFQIREVTFSRMKNYRTIFVAPAACAALLIGMVAESSSRVNPPPMPSPITCGPRPRLNPFRPTSGSWSGKAR